MKRGREKEEGREAQEGDKMNMSWGGESGRGKRPEGDRVTHQTELKPPAQGVSSFDVMGG